MLTKADVQIIVHLLLLIQMGVTERLESSISGNREVVVTLLNDNIILEIGGVPV